MNPNDIFKLPPLPLKRKLEVPVIPDFKNSRPRLSSPESQNGKGALKVNGNGNGPRKVTMTVEGEEEEEEGAETEEFAPGNDADYYAEEDEEGRFYGGGLNSTQKSILEIMDTEKEDAEPEILNLVGVRRHLLNLEKSINENNNMRSKFPNDPSKFVDSEYALEQAIRTLLLLTQSPTQYYPELIRLKTVDSLAQLLTHENVDIACTVVEVLDELLDEDVGVEEEEEEGEEGQKMEAFKTLVSSFVDLSALDLLVDNLSRLNAQEETERKGIYQTLSLFESFLSVLPSVSYTLLTHPSFLTFSLSQLKRKNVSSEESQNRYYIAELTAMLLQSVGVDDEKKRKKAIEMWGKEGVDAVLTALSVYRKREARESEEVEFVENLFDCLCAVVQIEDIKKAFLEAEGIELMVMMMKEKTLVRTGAIKVLSHALSGPEGSDLCLRFVEALGLKTLFAAFMGRGKKGHDKKSESRSEDEEHILSIISSLFSNLESDSTARIRLLAKFVEREREKVERLVDVKEELENLVEAKEREVDALKRSEDVELDDDEIYLRRLESGLFALQLANYILAWIVMEDDGIRDHVQMLFRRKGKNFKDVIKILEEYKNGMGEEAADQKSIIDQLIAYLNSV